MNLTDEQKTALNVGLATWEGWRECESCKAIGYSGQWRLPDDSGCQPDTPNYLDPLTGLSHINRLEERLTDEQHKRCRMIVKEALRFPLIGQHPDKLHRAYFSASAEQRAIALARTLNIQIEGVTQRADYLSQITKPTKDSSTQTETKQRQPRATFHQRRARMRNKPSSTVATSGRHVIRHTLKSS